MGLTGIESFGSLNILQVLVVCPVQKILGTFEPVTPFLQSQLDSQEPSVANITVPFSGRQAMREVGTGVEYMVCGGLLGEKRCSCLRKSGIGREATAETLAGSKWMLPLETM